MPRTLVVMVHCPMIYGVWLLFCRSMYELWGAARNYDDLRKAVEELPGEILVRSEADMTALSMSPFLAGAIPGCRL